MIYSKRYCVFHSLSLLERELLLVPMRERVTVCQRVQLKMFARDGATSRVFGIFDE